MASSGGPMPLPEDKNMGTVLLILTSVLIFFTITTTVLRLWARYMRGLIGWVRPSHASLHARDPISDKIDHRMTIRSACAAS
jgi:hypothetical protein